ncbi:MAG: hypothetical protein KZQ98_17830 [Candidatus Thiodiazotropha sp. (ex Lucinoma borealis)]|nr:hypothetical protein [Candidatus Thiodiazotropha sp. (ex Lucinoma borealis)]
MKPRKKPSYTEYENDLAAISQMPEDADVALAPRLVSLMTGKALKTLERDRTKRRGIPFTRLSYNRVVYSLRDVRAFLQKNRIETKEATQ